MANRPPTAVPWICMVFSSFQAWVKNRRPISRLRGMGRR
jgi:hypothetical protein